MQFSHLQVHEISQEREKEQERKQKLIILNCY